MLQRLRPFLRGHETKIFQQGKRKFELIERTNNERLGFLSCIQGNELSYIALSLCLVYIATCYSCGMICFFKERC